MSAIATARLAYLTQPDPHEPPVINIEIDGRFHRARLTESQRRNLTFDAARFAPQDDEGGHIRVAAACLGDEEAA